MFINRDFTRTEHDDWILNIQPKLDSRSESVEMKYMYRGTWILAGWKIQTRGE